MTKLSKKDLVTELQEVLAGKGMNLPKKDVETIFAAYGEMVENAIIATVEGAEHDSFGLGFATLKVVEVPERTGVSKLGGVEKTWVSPAHKTVRASFSTSLKAELKEKSAH